MRIFVKWEKKKRYKKERGRWYFCAWFCLSAFILLLLAAFAIDLNFFQYKHFVQIREFIYRNAARAFGVMNLATGKVENEYLIDSFCLVWGMTITILLFLLEIRNDYWYGIRFKKLIIMSFGKSVLILSGLIYMCLCPLVYFANTYRLYTAALLGIGFNFLFFLAVPVYVICQTLGSSIKLLRMESINELRRKVLEEGDAKEDSSRRQKRIDMDKKTYGYIQRKLENVPVTSMVENVDYKDSAEVELLIDTLLFMFEEYDLHNLIQNSVYSHGVLTTWMKKMMEKIDISTRYGQDCFGYIIARLSIGLDRILGPEKLGSEDSIKFRAAYKVECLLPLIWEGSENVAPVFNLVWRQSAEMQPLIIGYLFLYAEFRYHECSGILGGDFHNIIDEIPISHYSLWKSSALWDEALALEFWMSWVELRDSRNNFVMAQFLDFCQDMNFIANNERERVRTYTMRRVVLRAGGD